jgi:hypothetical protein
MAVMDERHSQCCRIGADPERIAILDNFCWGDPLRPETLGSLVEACRGCHDAALFYGTPFISGKDSLNNEYLGSDGQRHAIPPTLLISAIGIINDVNQAITMDLKEAGILFIWSVNFPQSKNLCPRFHYPHRRCIVLCIKPSPADSSSLHTTSAKVVSPLLLQRCVSAAASAWN